MLYFYWVSVFVETLCRTMLISGFWGIYFKGLKFFSKKVVRPYLRKVVGPVAVIYVCVMKSSNLSTNGVSESVLWHIVQSSGCVGSYKFVAVQI